MHERTQYAPLSYEEQRFAEENHHLVLNYLRRRNLEINDWYDVVIFRYLLTVKSWFQRPDLHQWKFSTIVKNAMRSAITGEREKQKRRIQTVSLDGIVPGTEDLRLIDTITEENLNFVIYVEGEDMNVSYNVKVPERKHGNFGSKSDEGKAIDAFIDTDMRNMCFEYDTVQEARKKLSTVRTYRKTHKHEDIYEMFRDENKIYVVKYTGKKKGVKK